MSWLKLDDQFFDHPKVVQAGRDAAWLHIAGMLYCARYLTDGFIPQGMVRRLTDVDRPEECAHTLVAVRLWEEAQGGYLVHDYLHYNPSRAKSEKDAEAARDRMRRNRAGDVRANEARTAEEVHAPRPRPRSRTPEPQPGPNSSSAPAVTLHPDLAAGFDMALLDRLLLLVKSERKLEHWERFPSQRWPEIARMAEGLGGGAGREAEIADLIVGLVTIGAEEQVAREVVLAAPGDAAEWLDHPDRWQAAKNPAGLIIKRLRDAAKEQQ